MKMITCVAWKANKVLDGSRLLVLIKNHRQLNCGAVVLCWPVIASETEKEIVRGAAADIATQFLPHALPPSPPPSVDFANFILQVSHGGVMKSPLEEHSLKLYFDRWKLLGQNVSWAHSVCTWKSSEALTVLFCSLRLFCHILHLMR